MTSLNVSPDLPVSFYLLKQCKLWIWDFDDTLIDASVYLKKDMNPEAILKRCDAELDEDVPQWRYFRRLTEFLVMHGRYVGIASFGTYEIIQAYMQRIMGFNQHFFTNKNIIAPKIKDRDVYRFNVPPNKNEYIYTLMQIYRVQDFKRVVLFDDKPSNVADAIAIGIIGIQIATPNNGDNPNGKMYFGPWIMDEFDNKIKNTCGDNIYLNRKFTGTIYSNKHQNNNTNTSINNFQNNSNDSRDSNDSSDSRDSRNMDINEINYGTGIRAENQNQPYNLNVNTSSMYKPVAFGTGIGDRKVLMQPQFRWNPYKNSQKSIPKWNNGNYVNKKGLVNTTGYWNENDILGGSSLSLWDNNQKVSNNKHNPELDNTNNNALDIETFTNKYDNSYDNSYDNLNNKTCCKNFEMNWIVLLLLLLFVVMIVIAINC